MGEIAEDELKNLGKVWASVFISLTYCFIIGKITQKGVTRLIAILPVICLFLTLPLKLTSLHFCGFTAFFIAWLANFKLLLFAFGKPPLCSNPPISFPCFLAVACLPIKVQNIYSSENDTKNPDQKLQNKSDPPKKNSPKSQNNKYPDHKIENKSDPSTQKSPWNYIIKGVLLALIIQIYNYSHHIHPKILWVIYFFHIYFALEILLAGLAKSAKLLLGLELEPQFNEPLLSTSLQDFWGKRWNLMVTSILRPTVFQPARDLSAPIVGRQVARMSAVMGTFVVSAVMHELIFFYLGRVRPTFEVTWFFLIHGFLLCLESAAKKKFGAKWRVPPWVSGGATVVLVLATGFWLFLPPLLRAGIATKGVQEYALAGAFLRRVTRGILSPHQIVAAHW